MINKTPLNIGHRGARACEPENTLRSLKFALDCGADMVEVDVRVAKDDYIVVMHDDTVDRTTNGTGKVRDLTLQELKSLDAGKSERIPTLQEAIDQVFGHAILVIELKELGIEEKVAEIIKDNKIEKSVLVSSFFHSSVKKIKELIPDLKTGVIFSSLPIYPERLAIDANADCLFPRYTRVTAEMIEIAHETGLEVFPWTINSMEEMKQFIALNVDGIVTDNPCLLKKTVQLSSTR
ncbi:MAG TPA: glycerophosphodiester phosphodiesterase [Methanosarcinales archaeon]|nr:glycerophosphodiester phosphodiesterase [Methanosarcinales archaeon]